MLFEFKSSVSASVLMLLRVLEKPNNTISLEKKTFNLFYFLLLFWPQILFPFLVLFFLFSFKILRLFMMSLISLIIMFSVFYSLIWGLERMNV